MYTFTNDTEFTNLAHNLTVLRQRHGLSKRRMAEILHISLQSLSMLEKGQVPPRPGVEALREKL